MTHWPTQEVCMSQTSLIAALTLLSVIACVPTLLLKAPIIPIVFKFPNSITDIPTQGLTYREE